MRPRLLVCSPGEGFQLVSECFGFFDPQAEKGQSFLAFSTEADHCLLST